MTPTKEPHLDAADLSIGSISLTPTGAVVATDFAPPLEDFEAAMSLVNRCSKASNWWIGDLANHAETWGAEYVEMLGRLDVEAETLRKCEQVSRFVPHGNRFPMLTWTHHLVVSPLAIDAQRKWLKAAQPKAGETKPRLSVAELRAAIRQEKITADKKANPFPDGTYRVILADPPWKYADELVDDYGPASRHYSTLTIEELCGMADANGKAIRDLAQPDAVLFLWVTSPLLQDAFRVVEAWGFRYRASFVWDKVRHNYGHYNSVRHELLLLCVRGSCPPDSKALFDSVVEAERSEVHSQKPAAFYEMIEAMYTSGPRLELFARAARDGWDAWGNQAPKPTERLI